MTGEQPASEPDGYTPITVPYHVLRDLLPPWPYAQDETGQWVYRRAVASAREAIATDENAKSPTSDVASSDSTSNSNAVSLEVPDA